MGSGSLRLRRNVLAEQEVNRPFPSRGEQRPLMSYLMFDAPYCKELMELGYEDGMAAREQILHLIGKDELIADQLRESPVP